MAVGKALHYVGTALLFIAMVLTIVVDVSAPVTESISFVSLDLPSGADAKFGVFGYCSKQGSESFSCSDSSLGYNPARVIEDINGGDYSNRRGDTIEALTRVLVLHPISTGALFLAFLLSIPANSTAISILATIVSFIAFIITAVAVVVDFVTFTLLGNEINDDRIGDATYGPAAYIALVAAILALLATILMLFTCCAGRRRNKRHARKTMDHTHDGGYDHSGAAY